MTHCDSQAPHSKCDECEAPLVNEWLHTLQAARHSTCVAPLQSDLHAGWLGNRVNVG